MSLYENFKKNIKSDLKEKMDLENVHQVPEIVKINVAMGVGSLATNHDMKDFSGLEEQLALITGQKPKMIRSKKSVSNFKLKKDMPVMLMSTLRGKRAYDFIERLVKLVLPRVRDFEWVETRKFDGQGNLNIGFEDQTVFSEIDPDDIEVEQWLQVTVVTGTKKDSEAKNLLEALGVIFIDNK